MFVCEWVWVCGLLCSRIAPHPLSPGFCSRFCWFTTVVVWAQLIHEWLRNIFHSLMMMLLFNPPTPSLEIQWNPIVTSAWNNAAPLLLLLLMICCSSDKRNHGVSHVGDCVVAVNPWALLKDFFQTLMCLQTQRNDVCTSTVTSDRHSKWHNIRLNNS